MEYAVITKHIHNTTKLMTRQHSLSFIKILTYPTDPPTTNTYVNVFHMRHGKKLSFFRSSHTNKDTRRQHSSLLLPHSSSLLQLHTYIHTQDKTGGREIETRDEEKRGNLSILPLTTPLYIQNKDQNKQTGDDRQDPGIGDEVEVMVVVVEEGGVLVWTQTNTKG